MRPTTYFSALNLTYYGTMVQLVEADKIQRKLNKD